MAPFQVYGNTYYVGTAMISSVLIASDDGLVLINGGMTQTAPRIVDNIEALGFSLADLKLIFNSHPHFDHAGGIAALERATGAEVAASIESAKALEMGHPTEDDPQRGIEDNVFPAVPDVRAVKDGEALAVGDVKITARYMPGHTPGSAAWTWRSCEEDRCLDVVFADTFSTRSAPGFRFTDDPERVETFRNSIAKVAGLPCDILLAPSPLSIDVEAKLKAREEDPETNPFIDPDACRAYAEAGTGRLEKRLAEEASDQ
ncbi:subclass B3 metallo-beta-lactamase [Hyphococcus luteus]|nr:subclass B3 metallo-beta-lactamase [Marinicaulis flavus]